MLNVLVAYPYMKPDDISLLQQNKSTTRFLLDSGAFTAWKAGKQINLDDYCRFIESLPFEPWGYFMLDVIGNPGATMKNYETMLKRGFKPIPIFTRGEDVSVLEDYYKNSEIVGFGGLVGTPGNKGFVKGIMDKVNGRKCHWLGFTQLNFIKHFKPYSCDASSWNNGAQFGYVTGFDKKRALLTKYSREEFFRLNEYDKKSFVEQFGLGGNKINPNNWSGHYGAPMLTGAKTWTDISKNLEKNKITFLFLAVAGSELMKILYAESQK